jgi:hypothetical protein
MGDENIENDIYATGSTRNMENKSYAGIAGAIYVEIYT